MVLAVQLEPLKKDCSTSLELARGWPPRCVGRLGSDLPAEAHAGTASRDEWETAKGRNKSCSSSLVGCHHPAACLLHRWTFFASAKEVLGLAQDDCACTRWRSAWELSGGAEGKSHPAVLQK